MAQEKHPMDHERAEIVRSLVFGVARAVAPDLAEDITQHVMARLVRQGVAYVDRRLIAKMCKGRATELRDVEQAFDTTGWFDRHAAGAAESTHSDHWTFEQDFDSRLLDADRRKLLWDELRKAPAPDRAVIAGTMTGRSCAAIARDMGVSRQRCGEILARATARLHKVLCEQPDA